MLASLARLFALRPFLAASIVGVPVLLAIIVGTAVIWAAKFAVMIVPIVLVVWLVRRLFRGTTHDGVVSSV
jgi:hypothetical protein